MTRAVIAVAAGVLFFAVSPALAQDGPDAVRLYRDGEAAERAGDLVTARHDYEQALAATHDDVLARHARVAVARLTDTVGPNGEWARVAVEHDRLESRIQTSDDPAPALRELEALVTANPAYPRAARAMVAIAHGWQKVGDLHEARRWLDRAATVAGAADQPYVVAEQVRVALLDGGFIAARAAIDGLPTSPVRDELRVLYARFLLRHNLRDLAWSVLLLLAEIALLAARLAAGSWRAMARMLARPPVEAMFLAPVAAALVAVAGTGNALVLRAVLAIGVSGVVVTWISGAILECVRTQRRVTWQRAALHAGLAVLAVVSATYIAVDHGMTIDQIVETWRNGPEK